MKIGSSNVPKKIAIDALKEFKETVNRHALDVAIKYIKQIEIARSTAAELRDAKNLAQWIIDSYSNENQYS